MNDQTGDHPERRAAGSSADPSTAPRRAAGPVPEGPAQEPERGDDSLGATAIRTPDDPPMYPGPPPHTSHGDDTRVSEAVPADGEPRSGRLLGDRYELDRVIGRGGMAEVHRAYDTRLGRWVAVKELRADLASDDTFQARFRREAQSAAGLNHPNIVAVYDTGDEYDPTSKLRIPFIVMELVEGHTLRDVLKDGRKILPERALELTVGVLEALTYSHRAGIIHRDIKPANVMLTPQGNVKVMDFGIARAVSDVSSSMTQTAAVIGTAQYLSPEQARGETVDARSDIYSAGCLLYELLIGRPPFMGDSPVSVAYQHVRELPVPPSQLDGMISRGIDSVVLTALAKDPGERYQTARAMAEDIERVLAGLDVGAPPPTSVSSATEPTAAMVAASPTERVLEPVVEDEPERRSALPVVLVLLSLVLVGLLGALAWWWLRPTTPAPDPQVAVPAVVGMSQAAAETEIRNARLLPRTSEVEGPVETVGTVLRQDPVAQVRLDPGETVTLHVNTGPRRATIPEVVGSTEEEARRLLSDAGFVNIEVIDATTEPDDAERGTVVRIRPSEGDTVAVGSKITLEVATGTIEMPDWVGLQRSDVESAAEGTFDNVRFEETETSDPTQDDVVLSTDPPAGTPVERTAVITVRIATYVEPEPEPTPTTEPPTTMPTTSPTLPVPTTSPSPSGG